MNGARPPFISYHLSEQNITLLTGLDHRLGSQAVGMKVIHNENLVVSLMKFMNFANFDTFHQPMKNTGTVLTYEEYMKDFGNQYTDAPNEAEDLCRPLYDFHVDPPCPDRS